MLPKLRRVKKKEPLHANRTIGNPCYYLPELLPLSAADATLRRQRTASLLVHIYISRPGDEGRLSTPQSFPDQHLEDPVATSVSLERKRYLLSCGTRYWAISIAITYQQQREG